MCAQGVRLLKKHQNDGFPGKNVYAFCIKICQLETSCGKKTNFFINTTKQIELAAPTCVKILKGGLHSGKLAGQVNLIQAIQTPICLSVNTIVDMLQCHLDHLIKTIL